MIRAISGQVIWGGTGERWDLLQLSKGGPFTGGEQLRERVRQILGMDLATPDPAAPPPLQFRSGSTIEARGEPLATQIDANGSSWALAADLLERYCLTHSWDAIRRRLLVGALDVVPLYREDAVQASVGWPLFELTLEQVSAPVILRGILMPEQATAPSASSSPTRVWCRVLEFAEEFGISVNFEPFRLGERRGG